MNVYLVAGEPSCAPHFNNALIAIGAKIIHSCAWVLPWNGTAATLAIALKGMVPSHTHFVVCEASGDWRLG